MPVPSKPVVLSLLGLAAGAAALGAWLYPPHVVLVDGQGVFHPAAGYQWSEKGSPFDFGTIWVPGASHPRFEHLVASNEQDSWQPLPGYVRNDPTKAESEVHWEPGRSEDGFPHVVAGTTEGRWVIDPGYDWTAIASSTYPQVVWQPGKTEPNFPHLVALPTEDNWKVDPGYSWAKGATQRNPVVVWTPGINHSDYPFVLASATEGQWTPAEGYMWYDPANSSDLRVVRPSPNRIYSLWSGLSAIDTDLARRQCSTQDDLLRSLADASRWYGQFDVSGVPVSLQSHVRGWHSALSDAQEAFSNCLAVDEVHDAGISFTDVVVGIGCLFADDTPECWKDSEGVRDIGKVAENLFTYGACKSAGETFKTRWNSLTQERIRLHQVGETVSEIRLPAATAPRICGMPQS